MDKAELEALIRKTICEEVLKEHLTDLGHLHDNVSSRTMVGRPWYEMINGLESVIDEMKDFRAMYSPTLHGPLPNTNEGMAKLQQIVQLLTELKPTVLAMDDIQRKDQ